MPFDPEQQQFDCFARYFIWRLGIDLAPLRLVEPPSGETGIPPHQLAAAEAELHRFFTDWYKDMYARPEAYALLHLDESFSAMDEPRMRAVHARIKKIMDGYLEWLLMLGLHSRLDGDVLRLAQADYERLVTREPERLKIRGNAERRRLAQENDGEGARLWAIPEAMERLGFAARSEDAAAEDGTVTVTNRAYPGMLPALSCLAKACAGNKAHGASLFRRCDFRGLLPGASPELTDVLAVIPEKDREKLFGIDRFLDKLQYKREMMTAAVWDGYRVRYTGRNKAMYWLRVRTPFQPAVHHHLRWELRSPLTGHIFDRIEQDTPGLSAPLFKKLYSCTGCRGDCTARVQLQRGSISISGCSDVGWGEIGTTPEDFEHLKLMLSAIDSYGRK